MVVDKFGCIQNTVHCVPKGQSHHSMFKFRIILGYVSNILKIHCNKNIF